MLDERLDPGDGRIQFLVAGMGIRDRRDRVRMPGEALCEEEVFRGPVDVRDRSMAERVEVVRPVEPRDHLPASEEPLELAQAQAPPHARQE